MIRLRNWKKAKFLVMISILTLIGAACSGVQTESPSVENGPKRDSTPVTFHLEGVRNQTLDSSTVDKPMFLSFWATWCPYCREEMPVIESLYDEYEGKVEFAAVNLTHQDSVSSVEDYVKEHDLRLPVYFDKDGAVTELFQVISTPTVVLLDPQGNEVYRKIGAGGKENEKEFRQQLDEVLADKQPQKGG
ncbi:TlpA family protein disulfide reductase [Desmospora profundinema]|uniref:Thiol-disulfide isomerase/thioredoxin n=1 Tax=Desmospora profundinema TaxID=1571184 RepID=A0ABU1IRP7_9BACL|nr:TlpA disulfide reductase family protein [Desmospora profundinema]MDR6226839.1 thiol-disulfide isomerase/thioredoxin [Desmospora profundinema]